MNQGFLQQITSRDSLLGIGATLVVAGIMLRGFARNAARDLARRKQHRLDERRSAESDLAHQLDRPPGWTERNSGRLAHATWIAGVVIALAAFFRR